ncbi:unnamed protein product [Vitrella brassicaformis CCMP3155]|uniref:Uncharacterized protein n=4 Tax=Vitrella brassicaformis TaxID=1169539 RepID=A0A0G4ENN3_VITBC|nr:unnamed protein product [Vitrella brassicaformis CCMP3155]|eukprot:CEL98594.1 unnamed protein product [Vitrella brassicaformis CCMP3155]
MGVSASSHELPASSACLGAHVTGPTASGPLLSGSDLTSRYSLSVNEPTDYVNEAAEAQARALAQGPSSSSSRSKRQRTVTVDVGVRKVSLPMCAEVVCKHVQGLMHVRLASSVVNKVETLHVPAASEADEPSTTSPHQPVYRKRRSSIISIANSLQSLAAGAPPNQRGVTEGGGVSEEKAWLSRLGFLVRQSVRSDPHVELDILFPHCSVALSPSLLSDGERAALARGFTARKDKKSSQYVRQVVFAARFCAQLHLPKTQQLQQPQPHGMVPGSSSPEAHAPPVAPSGRLLRSASSVTDFTDSLARLAYRRPSTVTQTSQATDTTDATHDPIVYVRMIRDGSDRQEDSNGVESMPLSAFLQRIENWAAACGHRAWEGLGESRRAPREMEGVEWKASLRKEVARWEGGREGDDYWVPLVHLDALLPAERQRLYYTQELQIARRTKRWTRALRCLSRIFDAQTTRPTSQQRQDLIMSFNALIHTTKRRLQGGLISQDEFRRRVRGISERVLQLIDQYLLPDDRHALDIAYSPPHKRDALGEALVMCLKGDVYYHLLKYCSSQSGAGKRAKDGASLVDAPSAASEELETPSADVQNFSRWYLPSRHCPPSGSLQRSTPTQDASSVSDTATRSRQRARRLFKSRSHSIDEEGDWLREGERAYGRALEAARSLDVDVVGEGPLSLHLHFVYKWARLLVDLRAEYAKALDALQDALMTIRAKEYTASLPPHLIKALTHAFYPSAGLASQQPAPPIDPCLHLPPFSRTSTTHQSSSDASDAAYLVQCDAAFVYGGGDDDEGGESDDELASVCEVADERGQQGQRHVAVGGVLVKKIRNKVEKYCVFLRTIITIVDLHFEEAALKEYYRQEGQTLLLENHMKRALRRSSSTLTHAVSPAVSPTASRRPSLLKALSTMSLSVPRDCIGIRDKQRVGESDGDVDLHRGESIDIDPSGPQKTGRGQGRGSTSSLLSSVSLTGDDANLNPLQQEILLERLKVAVHHKQQPASPGGLHDDMDSRRSSIASSAAAMRRHGSSDGMARLQLPAHSMWVKGGQRMSWRVYRTSVLTVPPSALHPQPVAFTDKDLRQLIDSSGGLLKGVTVLSQLPYPQHLHDQHTHSIPENLAVAIDMTAVESADEDQRHHQQDEHQRHHQHSPYHHDMSRSSTMPVAEREGAGPGSAGRGARRDSLQTIYEGPEH